MAISYYNYIVHNINIQQLCKTKFIVLYVAIANKVAYVVS